MKDYADLYSWGSGRTAVLILGLAARRVNLRFKLLNNERAVSLSTPYLALSALSSVELLACFLIDPLLV
jgi:hypothetical protein